MNLNLFQSLFSGPTHGHKLQTISGPSAVQLYADKDTIFVDVRSQVEISASGGTVKGAKIIPLHEFASRVKPEGGGDLPAVTDHMRIILVCASGARSGAAAQQLLKMGYENVANLRGGIGAWFQAGGKVQS